MMQRARWLRFLPGDEARWEGEAAVVAGELRCSCGAACSTHSWLFCCTCDAATYCRAEMLSTACAAERAMRHEVTKNGQVTQRPHRQTEKLVAVLRGDDVSEKSRLAAFRWLCGLIEAPLSAEVGRGAIKMVAEVLQASARALCVAEATWEGRAEEVQGVLKERRLKRQ